MSDSPNEIVSPANPRRIREAAGFSVRELAGRLGVTTQRVYAIESADDWLVSTVMSYYCACVGKGTLDGLEMRGILVLATRCLTGSLERWSEAEAGTGEVIQADFDYLCRTWERVFEREN